MPRIAALLLFVTRISITPLNQPNWEETQFPPPPPIAMATLEEFTVGQPGKTVAMTTVGLVAGAEVATLGLVEVAR